jgi:hypothetical protein
MRFLIASNNEVNILEICCFHRIFVSQFSDYFLLKLVENELFSKFNDNKLLLNHLFNCIIILFVFFKHLGSELIIILVSSTYKIWLDISDMVSGRSLIYKRNNTGPHMEPWETPCLTDSQSQLYGLESWSISALWNLSCKQELIKLLAFPVIP